MKKVEVEKGRKRMKQVEAEKKLDETEWLTLFLNLNL